MALNAVHIQARRSPSSDTCASEEQWDTLRTGESSNTLNLRMGLRFVRETDLSNPAALPSTKVALTEEEGPALPSGSSLSQFYATLPRDDAPSAITVTKQPRSPELRRRAQHSHQHRHDPSTRHKSDWFVAKALAKLRHTQIAGKGKQKQNDALPIGSSPTTHCSRCGETLPLEQTKEAMAQHRQSISHRLGLNAPVSSASASEATSLAPSETPTPLYRSRSPSPTRADQQSRSRSLSRRRLSSAARSKKIRHDNVGYGLLSKMGWKEGMGLGVEEWKWQQLSKEAHKQKLDRLRALIKQNSQLGTANETSSSISNDGAESAIATSNTDSSSEWMHLLPHTSLDAADSYQFGDDPPLPFDDDDEVQRYVYNNLPEQDRLALQEAIRTGALSLQDLMVIDPEQHTRENTMLEPIQVDVRPDRRGLGLESRRRRSRPEEDTVEIRKHVAASDADIKKFKGDSSAGRSQYLRPSSRSTKHQRKLAVERSKRDWLDLRASLS